MNKITQPRVRSAWYIHLTDHTSFADFSVSVVGLSNSIVAVDEGDGCTIVRKNEDGHVAIAFARVYRSRITSDAVTVHFDGIGLEGSGGRYETTGVLNGVVLGPMPHAGGDEVRNVWAEDVTLPLTPEAIKTLKRQAYGFRDMEYFKLKILGLHKARYALVG